MINRLKSTDYLVTIVIGIIGATVYVFTTFATVNYVDKKYDDMKTTIQDDIVDIKGSVKRIEDWIFKQQGGN
jgi:hypothetical protein